MPSSNNRGMRRDRQWMSKRMHSHSIAWRKRVIDKAIIVLGALIALLELIRFLLQLLN